MNEFHINNKILHAAIWGGTECYQMHGYVNADTNNMGRALIEYFTSRYFNIHRLPGYEPYYLGGPDYAFRKTAGKLSEVEFEDAYSEFVKLYLFTQDELRKSGIIVDGKVKLVRSLRPFEIKEVLPQILNKNEFIEYPANIITSYAHDVAPFGYFSWMSVIRDVPVESIVMYFDCLYHPNSTCAYRSHGGENEVLVVEKSIFGYTRLPAKDFIIYNNTIPSDELAKAKMVQPQYKRITHNNRVESISNESLMKAEIGFKPCEGNWLIKTLIKREVKKTEELLRCCY